MLILTSIRTNLKKPDVKDAVPELVNFGFPKLNLAYISVPLGSWPGTRTHSHICPIPIAQRAGPYASERCSGSAAAPEALSSRCGVASLEAIGERASSRTGAFDLKMMRRYNAIRLVL